MTTRDPLSSSSPSMPRDDRLSRLRALIAEILRRDAMGYTERFEHDAERFYQETGFMAPGKSVPWEMASSQRDDEREAAWQRWQGSQREAFRQALKDVALLLSVGEQRQGQEQQEDDQSRVGTMGDGHAVVPQPAKGQIDR